MPSCAFKRCTSRKKLHVFPKEDELRQQWTRACGLEPGWTPTSCSVICKRHFSRSSFLPSGRLQRTAIPLVEGTYFISYKLILGLKSPSPLHFLLLLLPLCSLPLSSLLLSVNPRKRFIYAPMFKFNIKGSHFSTRGGW